MGIGAAIAGIGAVGAIGSAAIGASSASKAAKAQENAAATASAQAEQQYQQTRSDLMPYQQYGQQAGNQLMAQMGNLTAPFQMTQANLEATPGYQFSLSQGLKSTNNALGARGLLNSGAVMKGAATYATGLADNTYENQFNNYQTQQTNAYNKLLGATQLGENAAAQTGSYGTQTAQTVSGNTIGAGNAAAAGLNGSAASIGNAFTGFSNSASNALLLSKYGSGIYGNGNSGSNYPAIEGWEYGNGG